MADLTMTTWDEFESALAEVLRRDVVERVTLNLGVRDDVPGPKIGAGFLQREGGETGPSPMLATIFGPGPDAVAGLSAESQQLLAEAGWSAESSGSSWGTRMSWPSSTSQYAALAHSIVVWFREVGGVTSPEVLGYAGWRDPQLPYDGSEEDVDPGRSVLYLPSLGITRELPKITGFPVARSLPVSECMSILDDFADQPHPLSRAAFDEVALMRGWFPIAEGPQVWALPIDYLNWVQVLSTGDEGAGQVLILVNAPAPEGESPDEGYLAEIWGRTADGFVAWMGEPEYYAPQEFLGRWSYRGIQVSLARSQEGQLFAVLGDIPTAENE